LKQELAGTDIDYKVYTDAAYYESPYHRHTYRYSPLLAYLMRFNHICQFSGKIAFVLFDVLAMIALVYMNRQSHKIAILKLYAYNPLFIYLTARGSCESISLALMFWSFYFIF
jgi:phosphatidylinositol glycan class M